MKEKNMNKKNGMEKKYNAVIISNSAVKNGTEMFLTKRRRRRSRRRRPKEKQKHRINTQNSPCFHLVGFIVPFSMCVCLSHTLSLAPVFVFCCYPKTKNVSLYQFICSNTASPSIYTYHTFRYISLAGAFIHVI